MDSTKICRRKKSNPFDIEYRTQRREAMSMSQEEKETVLDRLSITKRNAQKLEIRLHFQGDEDEAAKVRVKSEKLSKKIDKLLAALMTDWMDSSEVTTKSLEKVNRGILRVIEEIKDEIDVAKKVVKALGYLDDAINIATKLLA
jgi:hypothetical protein